MSKQIKDLQIEIQSNANKFLTAVNSPEILKELNIDRVIITETKRELTTQMAYYSRGRMKIEDVRKMYKAAGLYTPTDTECKTPNTYTLQSKHIEGKALDVVPEKDGKLLWNAPLSIWNKIGEIGKSYGFIWGGDWNDWKDYPHFEVE